MSSKRIANDPGQPCHVTETEFFNRLILDLKKQMVGQPFEAITMERLNEGTQHVFALDQCRRETRLW